MFVTVFENYQICLNLNVKSFSSLKPKVEDKKLLNSHTITNHRKLIGKYLMSSPNVSKFISKKKKIPMVSKFISKKIS